MRTNDWAKVGCAAMLLAACSSSTGASSKADGGAGDGGAARADGGTSARGDASVRLGSACKKDADCGRALFCDPEVDTSITASNLPAGVKKVPSSAFPGGSCTPQPAATYDPNGVRSCDPLAPGSQQGCGSDGACVAVLVDTKTEVACRPTCDPLDPKACGRLGYTCDFSLKACVEGCQSDEECRLQLVDSNSDGMPDDLTYDAQSKAICDTKTFRCVLPGAGGSQPTGAPCDRLDDCDPEGHCLQSLQTYGGMAFPGGYCTKLGCDLKGRDCTGDNAVCTQLRTWGSAGTLTGRSCLQGCAVGAEPAADQVGTNGHGKGCRAGYRCHYNGGSGTQQGVCVGGNYNAVTASNVGDKCENDADCYSPFGLGNCLSLSVGTVQSPTGVCSIMDCSVPGLPDDLCGSGNQCIGLSGDVTFCAKSCLEATECAAGQACADDDSDPSTPKICYPACFGDADCRAGQERCSATASTMVGSCVASRQ
jgi:hypothetical protein